MIRTMLLLALAALAAAPDPERIVLTLSVGAPSTTVTIAPDGTMIVDEAGQRRTLKAGPTTYERVAALVKPVRRWAGGKVPCEGDPPFVESYWKLAIVHIRWEPEGAAVEVPVTCRQGLARDEIELVRAALDETRRVAHDAPDIDGMTSNNAAEAVTDED
ncbi:MAG: hypothetical protein V4574_12175 [Pseudomonadota bacterium]